MALLDPSSTFLPSSASPLGQALATAPITSAVTTGANAAVNDAYSRLIAAYGEAATTYRKIVALEPDDASSQLQLADAAQNSGDAATAIAAYKRFLALAPDDPSAPLVKQQIQQLQTPATDG